MVSKKFVIENEQGLHMRPAGVLAKAVTKFESDVTIVFEDKKINAKSLLNIIGACIKCGLQMFRTMLSDNTELSGQLQGFNAYCSSYTQTKIWF